MNIMCLGQSDHPWCPNLTLHFRVDMSYCNIKSIKGCIFLRHNAEDLVVCSMYVIPFLLVEVHLYQFCVVWWNSNLMMEGVYSCPRLYLDEDKSIQSCMCTSKDSFFSGERHFFIHLKSWAFFRRQLFCSLQIFTATLKSSKHHPT
jgi:hypothetical protein